MRIVVIGTINLDTIELPGGQVEKSFGGLLYTILPLAMLTAPGATILPVVNLGRDVEAPVRDILSHHSRISQEGIRVVPEKNNHVFLRYTSHSEREEVQLGDLPPVTFDQLVPFLEADIILVNFISGRDMSLETLMELRRHTKAAIYIDIHSLSLGIDRRGRRYMRPLPRWRQWVTQADVIQMNHGEARLLSESELDSDEDVLSLGREVMKAGPSILLITLGAAGSVMLTSSGGEVCLERFSPSRPSQIKDTTGCGDVFLAAFVAEHVRSRDAREASRYANLVAGEKSGLKGIEQVAALGKLAPGEEGKKLDTEAEKTT
jgi:hypothetical protein